MSNRLANSLQASVQPQSPAVTEPFRPVFIVGCERSGTTLLAILMARHSRLAVTSETEYLSKFVPRHWWRRPRKLSHEVLIERYWPARRMIDLQLDREAVTERFRHYDATYRDFFRALLEEFAAREGKPRIGEKSPNHLRHVPQILRWFPEARIVGIVRDGRDVVQSLTQMPWAKGEPVRSHCMRWIRSSRQSRSFRRRYPAQFLVVKFEELVRDPERVLRLVDDFVSLGFEPAQLSTHVETRVVPGWEIGWKARALEGLDTGRIGVWKTEMSQDDRLIMNIMMRAELVRMGYEPDPPIHSPAQSLRIRLTDAIYLSGLYGLWDDAVVRPRRRRSQRRSASGSR